MQNVGVIQSVAGQLESVYSSLTPSSLRFILILIKRSSLSRVCGIKPASCDHGHHQPH